MCTVHYCTAKEKSNIHPEGTVASLHRVLVFQPVGVFELESAGQRSATLATISTYKAKAGKLCQCVTFFLENLNSFYASTQYDKLPVT